MIVNFENDGGTGDEKKNAHIFAGDGSAGGRVWK